MSFSGMAAVSRRIWRERNRQLCAKCGEIVGPGLEWEAHGRECQGKYRYFCPQCKRWLTLSLLAVRREMLRHNGKVDEATVKRLRPCTTKKAVAETR